MSLTETFRHPALRRLAGQFLRFGLVGVAGFLVDAGVLYGARHGLGLGLYSGRGVSYLAAATATWALNRRFTFQDAHPGSALAQWVRFLLANLPGGVANYGIYAGLVASVPLAAAHPTLAVAAGSLTGLVINFTASKMLVFRKR